MKLKKLKGSYLDQDTNSHNVVRLEVRLEDEMMEQNVEERNRQIQPAAAACHEGTAGGFQISITRATVAVNNDIKVVSSNPGVSNRWKSMIGKPIDQSISIDKIS